MSVVASRQSEGTWVNLRFNAATPFALRRGEPIYPPRLFEDIEAATRLIPEAEGDILLTCKGRYAFSVALFAAWRSGRQIILPPNLHGSSLQKIREMHHVAAELSDGFLAECATDTDPGTGDYALAFDTNADAVTLYTSGSTGQPQPVRKTIGNLFSEAMTLKHSLALPKGPLLASVPTYHLYGLTFSIMLPWVLGVPMADECPLHADEVSEAITANNARILVTVPVHLRALLAQQLGCSDLSVISSAGRLDEEIASKWHAQYGRDIIEIYGSSETGVIAHRQQDTCTLWKPFFGVNIARTDDGLLRVASPFIHQDEGPMFQTQDLVTMNDGGFRLHGRSDSIVKIAGRRISLLIVEQALMQCDGVVDAAVVAVPVQGHIRDMAIWAAVATDEAEAVSVRGIRAHLASKLDTIKLPRRIAIVRNLPREENGKLSHERLMGLFRKES
jgi:acyl-coenzyme A synthetase/AMP-(fatty) acid ligase